MQKDYQKPIFITLVVIAVSLVFIAGMIGYREYAQYNKKSTVEKFISKAVDDSVEKIGIKKGTVPDIKKRDNKPIKSMDDARKALQRSLERSKKRQN